MNELDPIFRVAYGSLFRVPYLRVRLPTIRKPSNGLVLFGVLCSYFIVLSGVIYDVINEPPSIGYGIDPVTGQYRPEAILQGRLNAQYIMEGFSAGMIFAIGTLGFLFLNWACAKKQSAFLQKLFLFGGAALAALGYNLAISMLKQKVHGYLH